MIEISHHGAVNGVIGSCQELSISSDDQLTQAGTLIDCGVFQGNESKHRATAENLAIDFSNDHIRALVVTHVHIDDVGRIPYLLAAWVRPSNYLLRAFRRDAPNDSGRCAEDWLYAGPSINRTCIGCDSRASGAGTVLIPAFSIGWTQELLYEIERLITEFGDSKIVQAKSGAARIWDNLEVVVDSPLAVEFTNIYRKLKPYWDEEAQTLVKSGRHPLSFEQLSVINSHDEHLNVVEYLSKSHRPCVVLAGSGMCAGGRVVNYLKAMLGDARNDVLLVGCQAAGTPRRDILTYGPEGGWVGLDGERYNVHSKVHQVSGYSARAGQDDLLRFIGGIPVPPKEIRIVHGDDDATAAFKRELETRLPNTQILIPRARPTDI